MAHHQQSYAVPIRVPRPSIASNTEYIDPNNTQVDPNTKIRQVRWNDEMDGFMITALVNQVLAGHKGSDNGFTSFQVSKAIDSITNGCGVVMSDKNGKPELGKWRMKLCRRYEEMELIFGNDTAIRDRAISGFPILVDKSLNEFDTPTEETDPSPNISRKRNDEEGTNKNRRKRAHHFDDRHGSLSVIAESSKKIAQAMQMQAALDTLNHVNWKLITEKQEAMDLDLVDILKVMKAFRADDDLAKIFVSLTNTTMMRALVYEQLGRDPPPLP
ncbi:Uncharacterized protein Adt_42349 [Abeliophyllum distichum]|uniref:Myb/SANT-like domain-containing protein n=1 Tax=Abeliophyllum distichum TaxID=126358 RepID=A0ABD1PRF5_9LAMI